MSDLAAPIDPAQKTEPPHEDAPAADQKALEDAALSARHCPKASSFAWWLAMALIVVGFLDVVSTDLALATGGAVEANPIVRQMQAAMGPWWVAPKILLHGGLAFMVVWYPNWTTRVTMSGVAGLVLAAAVNNFGIYADIVGWT
ncbi:MAG: DUF5658 family protein [Neomegalonema sp.]